jgi:hypothetical protein
LIRVTLMGAVLYRLGYIELRVRDEVKHLFMVIQRRLWHVKVYPRGEQK